MTSLTMPAAYALVAQDEMIYLDGGADLVAAIPDAEKAEGGFSFKLFLHNLRYVPGFIYNDLKRQVKELKEDAKSDLRNPVFWAVIGISFCTVYLANYDWDKVDITI